MCKTLPLNSNDEKPKRNKIYALRPGSKKCTDNVGVNFEWTFGVFVYGRAVQ